MAGASRRTFICQRGLSWGPNGEHAYEPGDIIRDLPTEYVAWMLAEGTITEAADPPARNRGASSATED